MSNFHCNILKWIIVIKYNSGIIKRENDSSKQVLTKYNAAFENK